MIETLTNNDSEIKKMLIDSLVKNWPKTVWGIEKNFNPSGRVNATHDWNIGGRTFLGLEDFLRLEFKFKSEKVQKAFDKKYPNLAHRTDGFFEFGFEVQYFNEENKHHKGFFNRMWVKFGTNLLEDEEYYDVTHDWEENFKTFSNHILNFY